SEVQTPNYISKLKPRSSHPSIAKMDLIRIGTRDIDRLKVGSTCIVMDKHQSKAAVQSGEVVIIRQGHGIESFRHIRPLHPIGHVETMHRSRSRKPWIQMQWHGIELRKLWILSLSLEESQNQGKAYEVFVHFIS